MLFRFKSLTTVLFVGFLAGPAAAQAKAPAITTLKEARKDPDFKIQGEYKGTIQAEEPMDVGVQVIAMGKGKFELASFLGGLPGDSWNGEKRPRIEATKRDDGSILFRGDQADGLLKDGVLTVLVDGNELGQLKRVARKSKTLKAEPPAGALVLFDGTSTDQWDNAVMDRKLLAFDPQGRGATSKQKFGSHQLHIEFRLPYMPTARGQGRGNSGLYLQSRYEVQMLDSFGLDGKDNECGGIYSISAPKLNMCYPPLRWQTYDVDFTAAKYGDDGRLVRHPRITVEHNGVVIHKDLELPKSTTASPLKPGPEDAPIYLQNHGNPVRYRNIWVVPKPEETN